MILLLLLSPLAEVFFKVTVLVPSYSTCVLIPSYKVFVKRSITNLAFPLMINLIVFLHQFTGSSLQMMQLLSQPTSKKTSFFWIARSNMIIRVDKCDIWDRKFSSRSLQYERRLFINTELVPTVKSCESCKCLGRYFNYEMDNETRKKKLKSHLSDTLCRIDALPALPRNKILHYQRYILSKLYWHLTVATLSKTWVIQHLNSWTSQLVPL